MNEELKNIGEEVHKEFQVERMILFSDAVFAIVITLMAIEIHIPEDLKITGTADLIHAIQHLFPTILAYIISFFFIGITWYQHLKIFGLLKSFDAGLVFLNLLLLFFIGLFPFSATLIAKGSTYTILPFYIYTGIIFCCLGAVTLIEHYVLVKKPALRNKSDISGQLKRFKERRFSMVLMSFVILAMLVCSWVFRGSLVEKFSPALFSLYPVLYLLLRKKYT
ncbi:MAG: DUF1211 domain-containing protein [Bacteroidia bacterium]|nr:DUF1211 domain-containing protein [Bacteroidia bacterium]